MQTRQLYIATAALLIAAFAAIIFFGVRSSLMQFRQPAAPKTIEKAAEPVLSEQIATPSIEEISGRPQAGEKKAAEKPAATLSEVYAQYPKADTGNNMVEAWARVRPEEKERAVEQLDQQISQASEMLKANPADKKAKHTLFIAESLKKMCKSNFNMSLLQKVPQEEGGLKKKTKK